MANEPPEEGAMRYVIVVLTAAVMVAATAFAGDYTGYPPDGVKGEAVVGLTAKKICGTKWGEDQRHVTNAMKAGIPRQSG